MSDQQPEITPQPDPTPQPVPTPVPFGVPAEGAPAKPNTNWLKIVIGMVVVAGVMLCGLAICAASAAPNFISSLSKSAEGLDDPINAFMIAMEDKDTDAAYALFSTRAKRNVKQSDLDDLLEGNNYYLFTGYKSVSITSLNIRAGVNASQNMPQGTTATLSGTVTYEGDITGQFDAVLEQEDGEWRLFNINVVAPPDKFPTGSN